MKKIKRDLQLLMVTGGGGGGEGEEGSVPPITFKVVLKL